MVSITRSLYRLVLCKLFNQRLICKCNIVLTKVCELNVTYTRLILHLTRTLNFTWQTACRLF